MGRKRTGSGKHIYICIALLICFTFSGCVSSVGNVGTDTTQGSEPRWRFLKTEDSQNKKNMFSSTDTSVGDEIVFNTGLNYADPGNPRKDYNRSVNSFKKITTEHPMSAWADRAHILLEILQENMKLKKQTTDLSQENMKLKEIIEESKKVDVEIERKKR